MWVCERGADIFMWGISLLHLSWGMVLSKASSAVNKQMFLRLHAVPANTYFVLSAASAITSAATLRRQFKREEQEGSHTFWPSIG